MNAARQAWCECNHKNEKANPRGSEMCLSNFRSFTPTIGLLSEILAERRRWSESEIDEESS